MTAEIEFSLLGPLTVRHRAAAVPVPRGKQRVILAMLLLNAGRVVRTDELADVLWPAGPPRSGPVAVQNYVMRLRNTLGDIGRARIITQPPGYLIRVQPGEFDLTRFEDLLAGARAATRDSCWDQAAARAREALQLWHGEPLADIGSEALTARVAPSLDELRLQALELRIDADLHRGHHTQLIPELRQLIGMHPLREHLHAQLMLTLYRDGRQAEALTAYTRARHNLITELGIEPGPGLRDLHQQILTNDPALTAPAPAAELASADGGSRGGAESAPVPHQLPSAVPSFIGRRTELEAITDLAGRVTKAAVVISAVDGMAGVGKTALAICAAHQLAGSFPGGQLFTDLHAYTRGRQPRTPGEALSGFLRTLGVPAQQIPEDTEERAALFRQRLAGTRTLIVLDNALDEAQVRPLLPGTPGCLVLVTSRRRLKGLHDAHVVALDVLPEPDALTLLRTVAAPTQAVDCGTGLAEIAGLCGRLPLALRIAAALLRHRPAWTPGHLAGLLRDEQRRLAALTDGDHDLRAIFDLSYTGLDERQRLLFRRLTLTPGPEFDAPAAAALLDADQAAAGGLLEDLVDHNLVIEHAPGRYRLHDLIRAHARALASGDPQPDRDGALDRLLAYYAHTAQRASALVARHPRPAPDGPAPASDPALIDPEEASAWLRAERENLEAACSRARDLGLDQHAVALTAGLAEILRTDSSVALALDLHQTAACIAERRGWPAARATALTDLASVRRMTGDLTGAAAAATQALGIYRTVGNRIGEATALIELSRVRLISGDLAAAAAAATQASQIYRAVGNRHGEAGALIDLGRVRLLTVDLAAAAAAATQASQIYRMVGNRLGEADALTDLGRVRRVTGDFAAAGDAATQALGIYRMVGNRLGEADALTELGRARGMTGDLAGAADAATQVLRISRAAGNRQSEATALAELGRARLAGGDLPGAGEALSGALEVYRALGNRSDEGWTLNHYAAVVAATGDLPRALELYQQALAMNRELDKPDDEALALEGIGECHLSAGQAGAGVSCLNRALEIYQRLGMTPDAERVRTRLAGLTTG